MPSAPSYTDRHPLVQWAQRNFIPVATMAKELDLSRTTIYYWERGRCAPRQFTLQMIVDYTKGAVTPTDCHNYWLARQRRRA